jgi:hypothetical protein
VLPRRGIGAWSVGNFRGGVYDTGTPGCSVRFDTAARWASDWISRASWHDIVCLMEPRPRPKHGYWPQGGSGKHSYENLDAALRWNAGWHAKRAVTLYTSSDGHDCLSAAVSTGCAVELLTKAYLASIEPTLVVADRDDGQSILVLAGRQDQASIGPTSVRSRLAVDCLSVAKKLHPALRWNPKTDSGVLNVRNAACHLGLVDMSELTAAIKIMVRIVEDLIAAMALPRDKFWGEHTVGVVDGLLDEAAKEVAVAVNAKVVRARLHLEAITGSLPQTATQAFLEALAGTVPHVFSDHEEPQTCPVCGYRGWLICGEDRGPVQWEEQDDGSRIAFVERTAFPIAFDCRVCNLELEADELSEFDFPTEIELEPDEDPHEVPDWEPTDIDMEEMKFVAEYGEPDN